MVHLKTRIPRTARARLFREITFGVRPNIEISLQFTADVSFGRDERSRTFRTVFLIFLRSGWKQRAFVVRACGKSSNAVFVAKVEIIDGGGGGVVGTENGRR